MLLSLLIAAAHTVLLHVVFVSALRRWPRQPRPDVSHLPPDEVRRRAVSANRVGTVLYLLAWPVITVAVFTGCYGLYLVSGPAAAGAVYVARANVGLYMVPAILLGFVLCGPAGMLGLRVWLGRRYHETMACGDKEFAFDVRRFIYVICVWIVPLTLDVTAHYAGAYVAFYPDRLAERPLADVRTREHAWADVRGIYRVAAWDPKEAAKIGREPKYVIAFADGRRWASDEPMATEADGLDAAVAMASARSGVPVREVRSAGDAK